MGMLDFAVGILLITTVLCACYLVLIRPQRRRLLELRKMTAQLCPGDRVVTAGGLIGTVMRNADPDTVVVQVARDVDVHIRRDLINDVVPASS
jgi:preprotein translocase subunit YajC